MGKGRLEAFSDGVIAIIITIMVLEMKVPHGMEFSSLKPLIPVFFSYVLSFVYLGIYWNNHHHLLHATSRVNGTILWSNLHLLFWLSLIPFVTGWMGENHFATAPVILYGIVLLMSGAAYVLLTHALVVFHGKKSALGVAIGRDTKGIVSLILYIAAIALSMVDSSISLTLYAIVAAMWFKPDRRIEKVLGTKKK